jgi:hypothetical protein
MSLVCSKVVVVKDARWTQAIVAIVLPERLRHYPGASPFSAKFHRSAHGVGRILPTRHPGVAGADAKIQG